MIIFVIQRTESIVDLTNAEYELHLIKSVDVLNGSKCISNRSVSLLLVSFAVKKERHSRKTIMRRDYI